MFVLLITLTSVCFAALAWRDLQFAIASLAGLLPLYLIRFSLGPIPFTLLEGLVLIAVAVWGVKRRPWKTLNLRTLYPWTQPLLLLLAAASFGVTIAPDTFSAHGIWKAYFIEPALVFLMLRQEFTTRDDWMKLFAGLGVSAGVLSIFALVQFATGDGIPVPWDIERRVTSVFEYPNALGLFLAPIVGIGITLFFCHWPKQRNTATVTKRLLRCARSDMSAWLAVAFLSMLAIVLAQTEAALVAVPAGLLLTLLISRAQRKIKIAAAGAAVIIVALTLAFVPVAREKLFLQDYSGQVRLSQWQETVAMLAHNPAFGAGLNGYPQALAPYHDAALYEIFQYPHNILLNIWTELGLLGLIAFFWLAVLTLKAVLSNPGDPVKLAAFAALAIMTIHGLVDVPYFKNDLAMFTWIVLAAMSAPVHAKSALHSTDADCGC